MDAHKSYSGLAPVRARGHQCCHCGGLRRCCPAAAGAHWTLCNGGEILVAHGFDQLLKVGLLVACGGCCRMCATNCATGY